MFRKKQGYALLSVILSFSIFFLLLGLLIITINDRIKLQNSYENNTKAYYLAESGISKSISYIYENYEFIDYDDKNKDEDKDNPNDKEKPKDKDKGKFKPKKNKNENLIDENNYILIKKEIERPFKEYYYKEHEIEWQIEHLENTNYYGITSSGLYHKKTIALESLVEFTPDNKINIIYLVQKEKE